MTLVLGIDPDTKNTGLAVVEFDYKRPIVQWIGTARVNSRWNVEKRILHMGPAIDLALKRIPTFIGELKVIVEGQEQYPGSRVRPNDLIHLAQVAGMATAHTESRFAASPIIVLPRVWKGSVPKKAHQKRILSGVVFDPDSGFEHLTKTQQGHVIDAIGLALWGFGKK